MIMCVQGPRAHLPDKSEPMVEFPEETETLWDPYKEYRVLTINYNYMFDSGWYWAGLNASEAHSVLKGAPVGTFLIRDSSHPKFMLTLSVKTVFGPTNVRIQYSDGRFCLDSSCPTKSRLQSFPDVPSLVQHYVGSKSEKVGAKIKEADCMTTLAPKECSVLLKLKKPIHRPPNFPSLLHLTRLVINKHASSTEKLPLPNRLLEYLQKYPFQL